MIGIQPRGFLLLVPMLLLACTNSGSSGSGMDTDTDTDTDGGPGSTSMMPTTDASSSSSTGEDPTSADASTSSTTGPDETGDTSTGEPDETSGGIADGICIGLDPNGSFAEVLSRNDATLDPACTDVPAPCGGDLLGTWTYADTCGEDNLPVVWATICPDAVETVTAATVEGTLTFNEDLTYARTQTATIETTLVIDAEDCLELTCLELEELMNADEGVAATCAEGKAGCDCAVETVVDAAEDGTYEAEDGAVTLAFDGEETGMLACVTGDRLDLWTEQYAFTIAEEACADDGDCEDALGDAHALYFCEAGDKR